VAKERSLSGRWRAELRPHSAPLAFEAIGAPGFPSLHECVPGKCMSAANLIVVYCGAEHAHDDPEERIRSAMWLALSGGDRRLG
jgi:hypothetical protein